MRSLTSSTDRCEAARVIRCPMCDLHSLPHHLFEWFPLFYHIERELVSEGTKDMREFLLKSKTYAHKVPYLIITRQRTKGQENVLCKLSRLRRTQIAEMRALLIIL